MRRVHPQHSKDLLEVPPLQESEEEPVKPKSSGIVSEFSWKMAISYAEQRVEKLLGRPSLYFLDGRPISHSGYLQNITMEICKEYGLQLLDVIADLILPVGFDYPSLTESLDDIVVDAFKPISKLGTMKTVIWMDDHQWNDPSNSILELFMLHLLMDNVEPYVIAPKYFDPEALSMLSGRLLTKNTTESEHEPVQTNGESEKGQQQRSESQGGWDAFSTLLKFGFLLLLRATNCSLIVIHINPKIAERIDAFQLLDLAEAEGHAVMYLKNTAATEEEREIDVKHFLTKLMKSPSVAPTPATSGTTSIMEKSMDSMNGNEKNDSSESSAALENAKGSCLMENFSIEDYTFTDSEDESF